MSRMAFVFTYFFVFIIMNGRSVSTVYSSYFCFLMTNKHKSINHGGTFWQGTIICPFYLKTGTCKYGVTCKFDHPPPGEVMAMATSQGASTSAGEEANGDEKEDGTAKEEE